MFHLLYTTILVQPLYNGLVALSNILPGHDLGLATIILTLVVRCILYPLSKKAAETQLRMKQIEPKMKEIREQIKDKQEQGVKIMALYKEHKLNPLSGILVLFIQLPIIFALYWVFRAGVTAHPDLLYPFVQIPTFVSTKLLGLFDLAGKSIILAILAGLSQYFVMHVTMGKTASSPDKGRDGVGSNSSKNENKKPTFGEDFQKSMQFQMRYLLPPFIAFIAYGIGGAISLYWITSNLFQLGQELAIKKRLEAKSTG